MKDVHKAYLTTEIEFYDAVLDTMIPISRDTEIMVNPEIGVALIFGEVVDIFPHEYTVVC